MPTEELPQTEEQRQTELQLLTMTANYRAHRLALNESSKKLAEVLQNNDDELGMLKSLAGALQVVNYHMSKCVELRAFILDHTN